MWTPGLSPAVDHHVPLVVRQLEEAFVAQRTVILLTLVTLLVFLQCVLHLKFLLTDAAAVQLLMNLHVCLQLLKATKVFIAFRASSLVFLDVNLQVLVEVFGKGKVSVTIGACVTLAVGCFAVGHDVSFQVIHSTKHFPAVATNEAPWA